MFVFGPVSAILIITIIVAIMFARRKKNLKIIIDLSPILSFHRPANLTK